VTIEAGGFAVKTIDGVNAAASANLDNIPLV
jgi:hypothetical protein